MEQKTNEFRIFLEDNEVCLKYSLLTTNDTIDEVLRFILNEIKKKHQTQFIQLRFTDEIQGDKEIVLKDILNKKATQGFIHIECKPFLKTKKDSSKRQVKDLFDLTDNSSIVVQKFKDYDIAKEKVTYNISVIKRLNEIFNNQAQNFLNDKQKDAIPTPNIVLNNQEELQQKTQYQPTNKVYNEAQDDNPDDINKRKKDFKKTGGAGGTYDFLQQSNKSKPVELQGYTPQEIAQHNTQLDCWTVYQGKVYDITNYIRYHPGGDKIMLGAGKDCTALFIKYHSWVNATFILQKYQVGFVVMKK